jgi:Holliday junction resolvase RusA-like endonuclease
MPSIKFTVYGEPTALKRHNMYRHKGKLISVNPSSKQEDDFLALAHQNRPDMPINTSTAISLSFFFGRPKYHYGTGKNSLILKEKAPKAHTSRPDIDNLIKFVFDSLNGVFWSDDSIISDIISHKFYDVRPRTEIEIIY